MQPPVQVFDFLHNILHLAFVLRLNFARLANSHVKRHPDRIRRTAGEPASGHMAAIGSQTDLVLTGVGGGEGKTARVAIALGNDPVVIIEGLVDGDEHLHIGIDGVRVAGLRVGDFGFEVACVVVLEYDASSPFVKINLVSTYQPPGYPWEAPRRNTWSASRPCRSTGRLRERRNR